MSSHLTRARGSRPAQSQRPATPPPTRQTASSAAACPAGAGWTTRVASRAVSNPRILQVFTLSACSALAATQTGSLARRVRCPPRVPPSRPHPSTPHPPTPPPYLWEEVACAARRVDVHQAPPARLADAAAARLAVLEQQQAASKRLPGHVSNASHCNDLCGNCIHPRSAMRDTSAPGRPARRLGRHPWRHLWRRPPPPPPLVAAEAAAAAAAPIGLRLSWLQLPLAARATAAWSCAPAASPPPGRAAGSARPPCLAGRSPSPY